MKLTFEEYQKNAATTAMGDNRLERAFLGIAGESGECAEAMKKYLRGDYGKDELQKRFEKEAGDILWYIAEACTVLDLDLGEVATKNNEKLLDRKNRGVIQGSGDDR